MIGGSDMYDVVIIGAGVTGCAVARELSRYDLKICVVERAEDVCCGTSKANSAIIHAGYDAVPGSLKAKLNVEGNEMMDDLVRDLDFPFRRNGSLVVMFEGDDRAKLEELLERGIKNGVKELRIIEKEELHRMEPNLADDAVAALYAPTAGIVCPFNMTIAFAENAYANGVEFKLNTEVKDIKKQADCYEIEAVKHEAFEPEEAVTIKTKTVVNAAGAYSDLIHNMVSADKHTIKPRRGCYFLLDKSAGSFVDKTIFTLPNEMGKGILTAPTVHGNLLVGPDAADVDLRDGVNTTAWELDKVRASACRNLKNPPLKSVITSFAGIRAHEENGDFIIEECPDAEYFFDCAGIESPGLSASPAIGKMMAEMVAKKLSAAKKDNFIATRKGILNPNKLSLEERNELIRKNPAYGNIICRCEMITEGEIIDAIKRPLGARSLDGVKRRTRAGMGRCQAGFCSPRTMEIISRECGIPLYKVTKSGGSSALIPNETLNDKYVIE